MNNVKVKKSDLLKKLVTNRATHAELYEDALAGWRKKAIAYFSRNLKAAQSGKKFETASVLTTPTSHVSDYDQAIAMLRMSVDDIIELTDDQFSSLVLDNWGWKRNFLVSNSGYSSKIAKFAR